MKDINPDGYVYLVQKLVHDARFDFMHSKPGQNRRTDAEEFVLSQWFSDLTGLEGWKVLREWDREYESKHKRKRHSRYTRKAVQCVETGQVFESIASAAASECLTSQAISLALKGKTSTAAGKHWRYVEEQQNDIQRV